MASACEATRSECPRVYASRRLDRRSQRAHGGEVALLQVRDEPRVLDRERRLVADRRERPDVVRRVPVRRV